MHEQQIIRKSLLKKDLFGEVWRVEHCGDEAILRDTRPARWWLSWLARGLMRREARSLAALAGLAGVPQIIITSDNYLLRTFMPGAPLFESGPDDANYFRNAARLLRRIHRAGVVHNDLAKEPNLLVCNAGAVGIIDFQLASYQRNRGRLFRAAAREDIRHLLKHKRTYYPERLTQREQAILDTPSFVSRAYMGSVKPVYLFFTRRMLGWSDREGAADR